MIKPINNHVLIEPVPHETFMQQDRETYEEIGVVVDYDGRIDGGTGLHSKMNKGDKVYFDSWLAAKFPKNDKESYWLVKYEDIRAIEHDESLSE